MKWRMVTGIVIAAVTVGLIVYDIFARFLGGAPATISEVLLAAAMHQPAVSFGAGFLCGHLFFLNGTD